MRHGAWMVVVIAGIVGGCVNISPPDVNVNTSSSPRVDSSKVPKTSSLSQCQDELQTAYARIQYLERRLEKARAENEKLKSEKKQLEKRLDRYED